MPTNAERRSCIAHSRAADDQITSPIAPISTPSPTIQQAIAWYAANREACPHPVVPALQRLFDLSSADAVRVIVAVSGRGRP